jgi:hypothetical protein
VKATHLQFLSTDQQGDKSVHDQAMPVAWPAISDKCTMQVLRVCRTNALADWKGHLPQPSQGVRNGWQKTSAEAMS